MNTASYWTCSRLTNVVVAGPFAYGIEAVDAYDPFTLYRNFEERRESNQPPHLVFANLQSRRDPKRYLSAGKNVIEKRLRLGSEIGDSEAAALFLATYGWPFDASPKTPQASVVGEKKERMEINGVIPEGRWGKKLQGKRPIMPPNSTNGQNVWKAVRLDEFWTKQQEFSLTARLLALVQNGDDQNFRRAFISPVCFPIGDSEVGLTWPILASLGQCFGVSTIHPHHRGPEYWKRVQGQVLQRIQSAQPQSLRNRACNFISNTLLERLRNVTPTLGLADTAFSSVWNCETLLEAMYVMLFLDVEYGRRILRCEGCGVLFGEVKKNVNHCRDRCGNRVRVRRATVLKSKGVNLTPSN